MPMQAMAQSLDGDEGLVLDDVDRLEVGNAFLWAASKEMSGSVICWFEQLVWQ